MNTKRCPKCKQVKPLSEFGVYRTGKYRAGNPRCQCRQCEREASNAWNRSHPGASVAWRHRTGNMRPMDTAKDCPMYLGVYIAERALSKFFDNIERMPANNPGYDFVCGKGFKIDVKSSCLLNKENKNPRWQFTIRHNTVADYFLCLGFDDRTSLEPMHVWLIPGRRINCMKGMSITNSPNVITKWEQYERPLDRLVACCDEMKQE